MKNWYRNLESRERLVLTGGAAVLVVFLGWALVWQPAVKAVGDLREGIRQQQDNVEWMTQAAREAKALRAAGGGRKKKGLGGRSLLAVVDQSARRAKLGLALKRVEPEGTDAVRVRLEDASFDAIVTWIGLLSRDQGVEVRSITVERQAVPGQVNSRVTLAEPATTQP